MFLIQIGIYRHDYQSYADYGSQIPLGYTPSKEKAEEIKEKVNTLMARYEGIEKDNDLKLFLENDNFITEIDALFPNSYYNIRETVLGYPHAYLEAFPCEITRINEAKF